MVKNPRTKYGTIYFDKKNGYVISSYKEGNRGKMLHRLNEKQKHITSVNLDKLKEKVLSKNLEWKKL